MTQVVGKTKRPTKAEASRMAAISNMLCVACCLYQKPTCARVEVHHLLSGGRRRGHLFTIPLCSWHHRSEQGDNTRAYMEAMYGPSLARAPKTFRKVFGTDDLLLSIVNKHLEST